MSLIPRSADTEPPLQFFRYHGIWAPGVRAFRHLRFRTKAIVVSLVFLLPAVVLGAAFLNDIQQQIEFSRKERAGIATMKRFVPVLQGVLETRNATRAMLGDYDAAKDYADARQRVDHALEALESQVREAKDPLEVSDRVAALRKAWADTAQSKNGADSQGRTVFGPVTEASLKVLQGLSDNSNLVLDPDLDTLYAIMAVFIDMPKTSEDLGQLWGWGTYGVAKGGLESPDQYRRYAVWLARTEGGTQDAKVAFERAFQANPKLKEQIPLTGLDEALKFHKMADVTEMVKNALEPGEVYAAGRKAVQAYFTVFDSALPAIDGLFEARIGQLETRRNTRAAVTALALLVGIYLFTCFAKVMDGGLDEVKFHLDRMAEGDLTQSPTPWGRDEAADLMVAMGRTQAAVRKIVTDVRLVADTIVTASAEIANGSMDLSARTERTAAELQQTAASLEQISATLGNTSTSTEHASSLAVQNAAAAKTGGEVIERAVTTMSEINAASKRIGDIIGTIDSIAFQTNILALNAAVEAARAGEQGRGFAVVASEVRNLAQRSAGAAREIKALITDTVGRVQAGTEVVGGAGQQMQAIVGNAGSISTLIAEISTAAHQQSQGVRQVGSSVTDLDRMTQENAALVEQTAAASASLKERAQELVQAVAKFRVQA